MGGKAMSTMGVDQLPFGSDRARLIDPPVCQAV